MPLSFDGQRILILGAGVTGNAVARSLVKRGAAVSFADENPVAKSEHTVIDAKNVVIKDFDSVVVSPGWRQDHPLVVAALQAGLTLLNEVDLAWQIKSEMAPGQKWLALTGTNGKTTTVEMVESGQSRQQLLCLSLPLLPILFLLKILIILSYSYYTI